MKIRVGVFFGSRSVEHEISIITALQAIHALDENKYEVVPVYISKEGEWYTGDYLLEIENYKDLDAVKKNSEKLVFSLNADEGRLFNYPKDKGLFRKNIFRDIDVAFPIIHGSHGEDGTIQGLFELMDLPYVGCSPLAAASGMDKILMKLVWQSQGLPILPFSWFYYSDWEKNKDVLKEVEDSLEYPMIVKPADLGSSIGIAKVYDRQELQAAVENAGAYSERIVVEKLLENFREINCSILGDHEETKTSVLEEPISSADFLSYKDKYLSGSKGKGTKGMSGAMRKIPAELTVETASKIRGYAAKGFTALDCSGVSRLDFLIDEAGQIYLNEINTIPGSLSFYLWEPSGISYVDLLEQLLQLALKRKRKKNKRVYSYESNVLAGQGVKGIKK